MGVVVKEGCSSPCLISSGTAERMRGREEGRLPGNWREGGREGERGRGREGEREGRRAGGRDREREIQVYC